MNFYLSTEIEWKDYSPFYDYSLVFFHDFKIGKTYFKKGQIMSVSYFYNELHYYIGDAIYNLIDTINGRDFQKEIGISFRHSKIIFDPISERAIYFLSYTKKIERKVPVYSYSNFGTKEKPRYITFQTHADITYLLSRKNEIIGFEFKNYKKYFNNMYPLINYAIYTLKQKFKNLNLRPCETSNFIYRMFGIDKY